LPYYSPHKFSHGHIQYGLANSETIADYKAVSLNVMHASMEITDEFYSVLNDDELQSRISTLGKEHSVKRSNQGAIQVLKDLLAQLEQQD
jgi:hypothetical protein